MGASRRNNSEGVVRLDVVENGVLYYILGLGKADGPGILQPVSIAVVSFFWVRLGFIMASSLPFASSNLAFKTS